MQYYNLPSTTGFPVLRSVIASHSVLGKLQLVEGVPNQSALAHARFSIPGPLVRWAIAAPNMSLAGLTSAVQSALHVAYDSVATQVAQAVKPGMTRLTVLQGQLNALSPANARLEWAFYDAHPVDAYRFTVVLDYLLH